MIEVHCKECSSTFEQKRSWQKFCSPACRTKHFLRNRNEEVAFARKIKAQSKRDLFGDRAA
jgi:hypothetical protein